MSLPLEDYALIGDCQTAALIGRDGSLDWMCWPRFDGDASFAALLGGPEQGRWRLGPVRAGTVQRAYRVGTLILDSSHTSEVGEVLVTDFMTAGEQGRAVIRIVEGRSGRVEMVSEFAPVTSYGSHPMSLRIMPTGVSARDGMRRLQLVVHGMNDRSLPAFAIHGSMARTTFSVGQGEWAAFVLGEIAPGDSRLLLDPWQALAATERFWTDWTKQGRVAAHSRAIAQSLLVLKSLAHPLGGIIAAPTTGLPQFLGGVRNWDYRYCWLRDGALAASVLARTGHVEEAKRWRSWLLGVAPQDLGQLQSIYGVGGERELGETELPWLSGYEGSRPVRTGNSAYAQLQLDALGWVMVALFDVRQHDAGNPRAGWPFERALAEHIVEVWPRPDHGVWEVRSHAQHFTDSKVMAWAALDRAIQSSERWSLSAPLDRWRAARDTIHREVCERAYSKALGTFVQAYDSNVLDSNLLLMPLTGFLPAGDERVARTIDAIERTLMENGLLRRYDRRVNDGLPPGQGAFLPCTFWLVECMAMIGREREARSLFDHVLSLANDIGLLSEQYDTQAQRLTGNFPQGFTHAALVRAALRL